MNKTILILAMICAMPVGAQPAPAASAPETTTGTVCGAAGVGDAMRYTKESPTRRVPVREIRQAAKAAPGELSYLVNAQGVWESCRMPTKPKDCQPQPVPSKWKGSSGRECGSTIGATLPARNIGPVDVTVYSQGYFDAKPAKGQTKGSLTYECRKEGWVVIRQYCQ